MLYYEKKAAITSYPTPIPSVPSCSFISIIFRFTAIMGQILIYTMFFSLYSAMFLQILLLASDNRPAEFEKTHRCGRTIKLSPTVFKELPLHFHPHKPMKVFMTADSSETPIWLLPYTKASSADAKYPCLLGNMFSIYIIPAANKSPVEGWKVFTRRPPGK